MEKDVFKLQGDDTPQHHWEDLYSGTVIIKRN